MRVLVKAGLVLALLVLATPHARAQSTGRYTFGGAAEQGIFVLDTESGRVWRYDRIDDAWYLYDLEALVRSPRTEPRGRSEREGEGRPEELGPEN